MRPRLATRRPIISRTGLLLVVVAAAGVGATSSASARTSELDAYLHPLRGTHGYRIGIEAMRVLHSQKRGRINVFTSKGARGAFYTAPAKVTHRRLSADLGEFGRIDLRFRPRHHAAQRSASKRASPAAGTGYGPALCVLTLDSKPGRFKGTIRFRGEAGYTTIRAHRDKGSVGAGKRSCSSGGGDDLHGTELHARSGSLRFAAVSYRRAPAPFFIATQTESVGPVRVQRYGIEPGRRSDFSFDSGLTSAHVEPPTAPFSGSADFTAPNGWAGSLSVSFPGVPHVPLTAAGFRATLKGF
ncbi:MAG: hypothetical protein ACRDMH_12245 [Solirubrobacterales bacterium]